MGTGTKTELGSFDHPAFFYQSQHEYLDCLVPFITGALEQERPALVAVPGPNLALLRDALGSATAEVTMVDMTEAGRNPGRILGGLLTVFAGKHPTKSVQMIGEPIWAGRSETEYPACVQHEALINNAFAGRNLTVLCPYDESQLNPAWIADARSTHPVLRQGSSEKSSVDFAPNAAWTRYNERLDRSEAAVTCRVRTLADLTEVRSIAVMYGQWFDLPSQTVNHLQLVATELVTSSLQSGNGACRLAFWQDDGHIVCELRDDGHLDDPLAGRRPYDIDTTRGRSLFVVNAFADLVRTHATPDGTTIHAYLQRAGAL